MIGLCSKPSGLCYLFLPFLFLEAILQPHGQLSSPRNRLEGTHEIFLGRLSFLLPLLLRGVPLRELLLPCANVEIELTHPSRAFVLGQMGRLSPVHSGESPGPRIKLRGERSGRIGRTGCERGIEVSERRVDTLCYRVGLHLLPLGQNRGCRSSRMRRRRASNAPLFLIVLILTFRLIIVIVVVSSGGWVLFAFRTLRLLLALLEGVGPRRFPCC